MDVVAEDAGFVEAETWLLAAAEFGASGKECVVADILNDGELCPRNTSGEKLRARFDRDDGIG